MNVLVAGGAGFIGAHLCRALLDRGHVVWCLDNLSTGSRSSIAPLELRDGFHFAEIDVAEALMVRSFPVVDVIVDLASPASPIDYWRMPLETLDANALGSRNMLALASELSARLVFASTSEVYGDPLEHPQAETYWGNVDPIGPRSMYDEGKRFAEAQITAWRHARGVNASIVRIFNTYGPGMRLDDGRVVPEFISSALTGRPLIVHGGSQTRSLMHVTDLVRGLLHVIHDKHADGLVANIGSSDEITMIDLARRVVILARSKSGIWHEEARPGDPSRRRADTSTMKARYGWTTLTSLDAGLRDTIAWARKELGQ